MRRNQVFGIIAIAGLAATANAQQRIHTVDNDDHSYDLSTAPSLAVNESIVVVAGSHELLIFDKGNPVTALSGAVTYGPTLPDAAFPFVPVNDAVPAQLRWPSLVFPRADHDPYTGRIWVAYSERFEQIPDEEGGPELEETCDPYLHLAIQKDLATNPQTDFSLGQWWYYTGTTISAPQGITRTALDLGNNDFATGVQPFRPDAVTVRDHDAPVSVRLPSLAFDETHVAVAVTTLVDCALPANGLGPAEQAIITIPRNHPGGSTVDGDRPAEVDMVVVRLRSDPLIQDGSFNNLAVQEPFEQHDNIMLFLSSTGADSIGFTQEHIRIKALFWDAVHGEWELRQQLDGVPGNFFLKDIDIPTDAYYRLDSGTVDEDNASAPDFEPGIDFEPAVDGDFFTSAVLAKDNAGNDRVFAV